MSNSSTIGRPTLLTPQVHEAIVECVKGGLPLANAARLNGVAEDTVQQWMERGLDRQCQGRTPEPCYVQFAHDIMLAREVVPQIAVSALVELTKSADKDHVRHQAADTLLSKHPHTRQTWHEMKPPVIVDTTGAQLMAALFQGLSEARAQLTKPDVIEGEVVERGEG